ncbi:hypothetical protein ACFQE1_02725 [Halobium palmae]|uniref:Sulfatase N-terminal domain-containing protein n=1 Tax=Halobium palmae TaxID=1776492 RepID=A0ABD5RVI0_9EURY
MEEDWDNLVILDACRFDMLDRRGLFGDTMSSRLSPGSESWEFMQASFEGRQLHDTVYVTANPHTSKLSTGTFHAVINLLDRYWNDEFHTVLPETVVEQTERAFDKYPDKRLISHFMQPHFPFIGKLGRTLDYKGIEPSRNGENWDERPHPWFTLLHDSTDDREGIIEAYKENLDVVLPYVERLLDSLSGKTIVTADHGNLLGEWTFPIPVRAYGHPRGLHKRELIKVPWVEVESAERRSVTTEPPVEHEEIDQDVLKERLADLGYHE